jgi:transposase
MTAVLQQKDNTMSHVLYLTFELSNKKWKLGFSNGQKKRIRTLQAGDWPTLLAEIKQAKARLNCTEDSTVVSCYEAGRNGFWIHRALVAEQIKSHVIDSANIEVNRRKRRVKTHKILIDCPWYSPGKDVRFTPTISHRQSSGYWL